MSAIALLYMRLFLPESVSRDSPETDCLLEKEAKWKLFDHSFEETIGLLRTRLLISYNPSFFMEDFIVIKTSFWMKSDP